MSTKRKEYKVDARTKKADLTTSQRSSWAFLAGKNKFDKKNSYATFCGENVPEKPLRTHRDNPPLISSELSVATMEIFPSRKNSWTDSAPKSS